MNKLGEKPKVSICVATYNQELYIKDCLLSVLMQDCDADLEILVGDDCSTDHTRGIILELAAAYPGRIIAPERKSNLGPSGNYQDLIRRASGHYIAHIDGDDYWMPDKLQMQLAHFKKFPACVAVYANTHIIDNSGQLTGIFNNKQPEVFDADYLLRGGNFLNHSSMIYRAELKPCLLELSDNFIDYRMHLRLSQFGEFGYVNRDLVAYRANSITSMTTNIPETVDNLYWEAITDPIITNVSTSSRMSAKIQFFSRIIYSSVRRGKFWYARKWLSRLQLEYQSQYRQIILRSIFKIPLLIGLSARRKIATALTGSNIYPRFLR